MSCETSSPLLSLEDVTKAFHVRKGMFGRMRLQAVAGASLALAPGESLGLVGESGCGKSTLGRLACGLLTPTTGGVRLEGRPLPPAGAASWAAGRVQMIFQDPFSSLNPRLTVEASVGEPLAAKGVPASQCRSRVEEMLQAVGLDGAAHKYPHEFSGGQRQRIAIARALVTRPDIVVCDEPVSALDASVQAQTLNLLRDVQEAYGPAYLFISHDMAAVGFVCKRILVMYLGRIVEVGNREAILGGARHPYTQALLAAVPTGCGRDPLPAPLVGEPPSPLDPPEGCAFHPRCPRAEAVCRSEVPELAEVAPGWMVRCHLRG